LFLTSESGGLYYGVTAFAAESLWQSAGDMAGDSFSEYDNDIVLRGELTFGSVTAAVSTSIEDTNGMEATDDATQLSVAAVADLGTFTVGVAYQEEAGTYDIVTTTDTVDTSTGSTTEPVTSTTTTAAGAGGGDLNADGVLGLFASTTVAGFAAYFNTDLGNDEYALQGSYDLGNGLVMTAGMIDGDDAGDNDFANFIVADYDLGGGASVMASFAEGNNATTDASDDIDTFGGYELKAGTTIKLSFAF
jgi:outer membrane protein OmpU